MGIDLWTALVIQGNEVDIETYSNPEKTNYGFIISRMERDNYRMIVSTLPNYPYSNRKEAQDAGEKLVAEIKRLDLNPERSKLIGIIGEEDAKVVSEIIKKANE